MHVYLYVVLGYLVALFAVNLYYARRVRSGDDYMLAGRSLSLTTMVFTLICTWIGSGTFIAGAEYAATAGWSSLWMPAGAWIGIALIYFLAARIRTFGQYTVGDILEVRYGRFARVFGAISIVIAFTTIVAYQFRAGGYILNIASKGAISVETGQALTAAFVILFTVIGGMVAVAHTDLPNGIIIVLACVAALPFVYLGAGGFEGAAAALPPSHYDVFARDFGEFPALKGAGYCLATLLLLMGIQSMYQKFYAARTPGEAKRAVAIWIVGTIVVETVVVAIAVFAASQNWQEIKEFQVTSDMKAVVTTPAPMKVAEEDTALFVASFGRAPEAGAAHVDARDLDALAAYALARRLRDGELTAAQADTVRGRVTADIVAAEGDVEAFVGRSYGVDPRSIVLRAAEQVADRGGVFALFGLLLLAAACAVVLSTGMNYLLSPSTNVIRDIYPLFAKEPPSEKKAIALQRLFVVVIGVFAFLAVYLPAAFHLEISVLQYSYFAYTMYGVAITPALLAALAWKRVTKLGGILSIVLGALSAVTFELILPNLAPAIMRGGDPFGIPSIFPSAFLSVAGLLVGTYASRAPAAAPLPGVEAA